MDVKKVGDQILFAMLASVLKNSLLDSFLFFVVVLELPYVSKPNGVSVTLINFYDYL